MSAKGVRDLPAIALTAFANKDGVRRVLLAGFQVHVAKPVDPHDLTVDHRQPRGAHGLNPRSTSERVGSSSC